MYAVTIYLFYKLHNLDFVEQKSKEYQVELIAVNFLKCTPEAIGSISAEN
jgi:hypothetical protein